MCMVGRRPACLVSRGIHLLIGICLITIGSGCEDRRHCLAGSLRGWPVRCHVLIAA
jgi:hypothetical protein